MKKLDYTTSIIIILALHLLFVNSEIIIKLLKLINSAPKLHWWQSAGAILFALSYSLITVLIIKVYPKIWLFGLTALFDGFAVFLNYDPKPWFIHAAAVYLGLYTTLIILATGFVERHQKQNQAKTELIQNKTELIRKLTAERRSLQQSIRRLKDENQRQEKQNRLHEIENQLSLLTSQNVTNADNVQKTLNSKF